MEAHLGAVIRYKELNDYIAVFDGLKLVLQEEQLRNRMQYTPQSNKSKKKIHNDFMNY